MKDLTSVITVELEALRALFQAWDFDLRLVGGVVRDMLSDVTPKDVDLCTDADPEQMMMIFREHGVTFYETGLQHGTLTVNLNGQIYEITSLRTDSNHDGRHAEVTYTRDWLADLARRDLTVNAMALTFDGDLIDPFNGAADLAAKKVRFVGDPNQRMREDYLRILRFFRFHARIANALAIDDETTVARSSATPMGCARSPRSGSGPRCRRSSPATSVR
jgi:tRNA nucleotidyltransferase/poly(A) polymerase